MAWLQEMCRIRHVFLKDVFHHKKVNLGPCLEIANAERSREICRRQHEISPQFRLVSNDKVGGMLATVGMPNKTALSCFAF